MVNSKQKGARGERELANRLKEYGYETRRGQQYNGLEGDDVVGLPYVHIECKRVQNLNVLKAYEQSCRDAKEHEIPTVFHRKDRSPWLVTLSLESFMMLYKGWQNGKEK